MGKEAGQRPQSFFGNMLALLTVMPRHRRIQLGITLVLTFIGAIAELVTIGAVLPMLAIVANSEQAGQMPIFAKVLDLLGIPPGGNLILPAAMFLIVAAIVSAMVRLMLTWVTQKFVFGVQLDIATRVYGNL